ncbi:unnamed protein product [Ectocarpus sp. CCAP 1310/34]|nr:unnamed protein product [Ectocarpus sp. CCAP 1310/34]
MSRRSSVETGVKSNGSGRGGGRAAESSERTPLLFSHEADHDVGQDDQASLPSSGGRDPQRRRPSLPALKKLDPYPGDGLGARTANAMVRARDELVEMLCCSSVQRWIDRHRNRDEELNIYSLASLAIVMSYFSIGVALELLYTPIAYYLIDDLGAESGVYTVWVILVTLPWSFKAAYGFLSDCMPIHGLKRKPYMLIGWGIHILSNSALAIMGTPGENAVVVLSFLSACGYLLSDVMTDAIVVEKTQRESMSNMGNIQASGYIARYFGSAIGAVGGAVLYNKDTWGWGLTISELFWINALVPMVLVIPLMPFLLEDKKPRETGVLKRHSDELWTLVQKNAVWRPMIFVYLYNALMLPNGAWTNYLVETLDFSDWDIGVVNICSQICAWLGLIVYKKWMGDVSWPSLYWYTTFLTFVVTIAQLLLILGISTSWGIPNLLFASGDEAVSEVILALQFLPLTRMYAVMCPTGSEGTSYALLTTVSNVAYAVAYAIGDLLTDLGGSWSTSNATLLAGDMSGMWRLTLLTSCVAVTPMFLVWLLPRNKKEQQELQKSSANNRLGGQIFLMVAGLSILFTIVEAVVELIEA